MGVEEDGEGSSLRGIDPDVDCVDENSSRGGGESDEVKLRDGAGGEVVERDVVGTPFWESGVVEEEESRGPVESSRTVGTRP